MRMTEWCPSGLALVGTFLFGFFYLHKVIYLMKVYTSRFVLVDVRSYIFRHAFFIHEFTLVVYSRAIDRLCEQDLFSFVCTRCVLYLVFESCSKDVSRCVYASLYFVFFHNRGHCFDKVISPPRGFYLLNSVSWTQLARGTSTGQTRDINCVSCPKPECIATVSCVSHTNIGALYEHSGYIYIL